MVSNEEEYVDWQSGELTVVKSIQGHYSIWPTDKDIPDGWEEIGFKGQKEACLKKIEEIWDGNVVPNKKT